MKQTDDLRITGKKGLIPPVIMHDEVPIDEPAAETISATRILVSQCLHGLDDRLVVVVGPCSIHDMDAALEYADQLNSARKNLEKELCIIMRVYFEKPRTTIGWKGFINDPDLDNSFNVNKGLKLARELLLKINQKGLACGTEFLDTISPQYLADLVSWGAIGARTTESQVHRELASGLSATIGFKNATSGDVQVAIDAIQAAQCSHHFLSITKQGHTAIFKTAGNKDTHVILRGGSDGPNYDQKIIRAACEKLKNLNLAPRLMVDCSHGNSQKNYLKQKEVAQEIARQISLGSQDIFGLMIESHIYAGNQNINASPRQYGVSITDACLSWEDTLPVLEILAEAVKTRRALNIK